MTKFFDVLGQELFHGAIIIFPETRNYYNYGVVRKIGQFGLIVDVIESRTTVLPDSEKVTFAEYIFTSVSDRGVLVIHPELMRHSNRVSPRQWKKQLIDLSHSLIRMSPKD